MASHSSSFSSSETMASSSVDIPYDIFLRIVDFVTIEPLLDLRLVSKGVKDFVDKDFSDDEWQQRIETIPAALGPEKVSVHNRLTLACLRSPCCSLCGKKYKARSKGTDDIFGIYGHEKCLKKQLYKQGKLHKMLNKFLPNGREGGGSSSAAASSFSKSDTNSSAVSFRVTRDEVKSFGCKTMRLPGFIPGYMCCDGVYRGSNYTFDALWLMPRWCIRHTFFDAVAAKKAEDPNDAKAAAIYDALDETYKNEIVKFEKKKANAIKKKAEAMKKEEAAMQRLSELRAYVGPELYSKITELASDLEKTKKTLKRKHGKNDWEWADEIVKVDQEAEDGRLQHHVNCVKAGQTLVHGWDRKKRRIVPKPAGMHLPVSIWEEHLKVASEKLAAYKEQHVEPPKKKVKKSSK